MIVGQILSQDEGQGHDSEHTHDCRHMDQHSHDCRTWTNTVTIAGHGPAQSQLQARGRVSDETFMIILTERSQSQSRLS